MTTARTLFSIAAIVALPSWSPVAQAEPLVLNTGSAVVSPLGGPGMTLTAILAGDGFTASFRWLFPTTPCTFGCQAGDSVELTTTASVDVIQAPPVPNVAVGSATVDGITYEGIAFGGQLTFSGPALTLPAVPHPTDIASLPFPVLLSGPFTLTGTLSGYLVRDVRDPQLLFSRDLYGIGNVTALYLGGPDNRYMLQSINYELTPVPEPGTMLLVGTGLAAACLRRRQRSRQAGS